MSSTGQPEPPQQPQQPQQPQPTDYNTSTLGQTVKAILNGENVAVPSVIDISTKEDIYRSLIDTSVHIMDVLDRATYINSAKARTIWATWLPIVRDQHSLKELPSYVTRILLVDCLKDAQTIAQGGHL
jgi:hypothetical protein